ncbi:outer dense fiber protein 3-like [Phymastichus coffea]|uniref:outer dense fiber protein 3-like n=1 Tax=Phymastichus coffea TaxID=108790 RepID=UPI00273B7065|nr:outer dense fiber protein 3-like [Phymastichus coffea]
MEEPKSKPKNLACMNRSPGPTYQLKSLTGFENHDPSRYRYPAYSIRIKPKTKVVSTGPGPYPVPGYFTRYGPEIPPAYTMQFKPKQRTGTRIPGPGAHAPEKCPLANHSKNSPAYSMIFRNGKMPIKEGPGPIYMVPTCIGPEIPDIRAEGAYSMAFKRKEKIRSLGPGPAAYEIKLNVYKKQNPAFSMKFGRKFDYHKNVPGPQYSYDINLVKRQQPKYSIGVKYSECVNVGLMENDD